MSEYRYLTLTGLELFTRKDYSNIDSSYTSGVILAQITTAEQLVNTICGQTFTGTIPDGVQLATKIVAKELMLNILFEDGYLPEVPYNKKFWDDQIMTALNPHLFSYDPSIPMQGIER